MSNLQDQLTEHFYNWESLGRGGVLFDQPVSIEPSYFKFSHSGHQVGSSLDDGKVPSLLTSLINSVRNLFSTEVLEDEDLEQEEYSTDHFDPTNRHLKGFRFSFAKDFETHVGHVVELFNALSYSEYQLSFEVVANAKSIDFQFVGASDDIQKVQQHLMALFPSAILDPIDDVLDLPFSYDESNQVAIADMAPNEEFMRPLKQAQNFSIDPLTSVITTLDHLRNDEHVMIQVLFLGVKHPWRYDMLHAVSNGRGGSFFTEDSEMLPCTNDKVSSPLFSCVIRIASQSGFAQRSEALTYEIANHLGRASESHYNKLVLLPNEGYEYNQHVTNLHLRKSNRWGFFINSKELAQLAHYPHRVHSSKLGFEGAASTSPPEECKQGAYDIGLNIHQGVSQRVMLSDEMRVRHTHIIGATGVGKSTLIAHMMGEDIKAGNGCALFDPHGDIVEQVLALVPKERIKDVILIDPSDSEFPVGFNLLEADTEAEKVILSSDLVAAFAEHSTSWGDQMTSVLSNAINAFLYSKQGGTLIELKRFLLEKKFRDSYLNTVEDPAIRYYWEHDFPMLRKGSLSPLLTRIDTFLRPSTIRNMLAQKRGVNFKSAIEQKKILLIKLSQGLIGEDNSYVLASLFLAKMLQATLARQALPPQQRHPYYVYLDEFQNFLTPSIPHILSGARKYGLGLILAHQELAQIDDQKIIGSVISNPCIRICFRLGDADARRLEGGFKNFTKEDFQSLSTGQAIMRIGSASSDVNVQCYLPKQKNKQEVQKVRQAIMAHSRATYGASKEEVEAIIQNLFPRSESTQKAPPASIKTDEGAVSRKEQKQNPSSNHQTEQKSALHDSSEELIQTNDDFDYQSIVHDRSQAQQHQKIQRDIKKIGQKFNFLSTIEKGIEGAKRIDVLLIRSDVTIAVEVSVSNTIDYEIENIQKCLAHATHIVMTSPNSRHLEHIKDKARQVFTKDILARLHFFLPSEVESFLASFKKPTVSETEKIVHGYRVKVTEAKTDPQSLANKMSELAKIMSKGGEKP
jgi:hypothetical protein